MRDFIFAANWKLNKTPQEARAFFAEFLPQLAKRDLGKSSTGGDKRTIFFVPALLMETSEASIRSGVTTNVVARKGGRAMVEVGVQNVYFENSGAFTGENSPAVVKAIGAQWALIGHSERRTLFGETDEQCGKKMKASLDAGLSTMLCVGETLAERDGSKTMTVVERQVRSGLASLHATLAKNPERVVIAYEPVWAIGTGKVATPEQATEVHQAIRAILTKDFGPETANNIAILYGGSVKPDNAAAIGAKPDIDGFLVGGASLETKSFLGLMTT